MSDLDVALLGLWLTITAWTVWAAVLTYWLLVYPQQRREAARRRGEGKPAPEMVPASSLIVAQWVADVNRVNGGPWPIYYWSQHLGRHRASPESSATEVRLVAVSDE